MKRVLIISPYFPPVNAADMQRVRMSLPYFKDFGWDAEVVCVDPEYVDIAKDDLLIESVPQATKIHKVQAFNKSWTSKLGLGSIALRSVYFYLKKVNQLLKTGKYDLIYFSTTQFPVCSLGSYWKKRFGIPYVIDMQDPWHSEYYQHKSKGQRPPKYWFSYRLNKYLEPKAVKNSDGLISVSDDYIDDLKKRYPEVSSRPSATITFGAFDADLKIAADYSDTFPPLLKSGFKNVVYVGRGGNDMHKAVTPLFEAFKQALASDGQMFSKLKFYFIGTSYAANGQGIPTLLPLAEQYGIENNVIEITDRISYYHSLVTLQQADALFIPGSDDPKYTASKIYPYLMVNKPLLAIFNKKSSAISILKEYGATHIYNYDDVQKKDLTGFLRSVGDGQLAPPQYNDNAINRYSARQMTLKQCRLFNLVLNAKN